MNGEIFGLINIIGAVFLIFGSVSYFNSDRIGFVGIRYDLFGISMIVIGVLIVTLNTLVAATS